MKGKKTQITALSLKNISWNIYIFILLKLCGILKKISKMLFFKKVLIEAFYFKLISILLIVKSENYAYSLENASYNPKVL